MHQHVAARVKDPRIRMALSFHPLFIGGNPFRVTAIYSMIAYLEREFGVHAAMGGTNRIVSGMVKLIRGQGGTLRCNAEVDEITCTGRRATASALAGGEVIPAEIVVSNADTAQTYRKLLKSTQRKRWTDRRMARARHSMSLFVWYFGTSKTFPGVRHHTILMGPRYRELLHDIFERKHLAEDFSLYIHRPTATDPSLAPEGCDSFYVLSPVPQPGLRHRLAQEGRILPSRHRAQVGRDRASRLRAAHRDRTADDADRLRDAAFVIQGRGLRAGAVLLQSAWFRPTTGARTSPISSSSVPARIRRRHSGRHLVSSYPRHGRSRCSPFRLIR